MLCAGLIIVSSSLHFKTRQQVTPHVLISLGSKREAFGDPYPFEDLRTKFRSNFNVKYTSDPSTLILFPILRSDRRYYITYYSDERIQIVLNKREGSKTIPCWQYEIKRRPSDKRMRRINQGAIARFLGIEHVDRGIYDSPLRHVLGSVKPFAAYQIDVIAGTMQFGFLDFEGNLSFTQNGQDASVPINYDAKLRIPRIGRSYPIHEREVAIYEKHALPSRS